MVTKYTNRYGEEYSFTAQEDGSILWEGNFKYCRFGMPNDYSKAWEKFQEDYGGLSYEAFVESVHAYDEEKRQYVFADLVPLITSMKDKIDMVDPSGGPYITVGMDMKMFGHKGTVKDITWSKEGYRLIVE